MSEKKHSKQSYYQKFRVLDGTRRYIVEVKPVPVKKKVRVIVKKPWSSDRLIKR